MSSFGIIPGSDLAYMQADRLEPVLDRTIGDALRAAADAWGERTALVDGSIGSGPRPRWSYVSLLRAAKQAAYALLGRFSPGEHVAICAANSPDWVLVEFGAALAGIVLVTANPALPSQELCYLLRQSKASGILVQPEYRGRNLLAAVEEIRPNLISLREVISLADWPGIVASTPNGARLPSVSAADVAQIQYTSGTTGQPKGALLTHRGLGNNARFYARTIGTGADAMERPDMALPDAQTLALITVIGAVGTMTPLLLYQFALRRIDELGFMICVASQPILSFLMSLLSPAYEWDLLTLFGVVAVTLFVGLDILVQRRAALARG